MDDDIPYLLLTPGPLTTSRAVREAMLRDYCTWDDDYNGQIVQPIRRELVELASSSGNYTSVLMQGSGTFAVEAVLGTAVPQDGKLLILNNGAYGARLVEIARCLGIDHVELAWVETQPPDVSELRAALENDPRISHVVVVHCETTTGMLNPVEEIGAVVGAYDKVFIVDAMSSFGGIPMQAEEIGAHYIISSANKCIQGVPGFGFVIADRRHLEQTAGWARSLSLDLYAQWREMETHNGKWRFTSPTHVVRAFARALEELDAEGGVAFRFERYRENHRRLVAGMGRLGMSTLLKPEHQSPIITSFVYPDAAAFSFERLYAALKARRFVIYPGKVSQAATFRIGTIGHVFPHDIDDLLVAMGEALDEIGVRAASVRAS